MHGPSLQQTTFVDPAERMAIDMAVEGSVALPGVIVPHLVVRMRPRSSTFTPGPLAHLCCTARRLPAEPESTFISESGRHCFRSQPKSQLKGENAPKEPCLLRRSRSRGRHACSRSGSRAWTKPIDTLSAKGRRPHGRRLICSGATGMAGSAIRWGTYGALSKVREFLTLEQVEERMRGFAAQMRGEGR